MLKKYFFIFSIWCKNRTNEDRRRIWYKCDDSIAIGYRVQTLHQKRSLIKTFCNLLLISSSNYRLNVNWLKLNWVRLVPDLCWLMLTYLGHFLTCVDSCWLVSDLCWLVLDSCWFVLTRVDLCWYSCIRIDLIVNNVKIIIYEKKDIFCN